MSPSIIPVDALDAPELKRFMTEVIADSLTRDEPVYSEMVANVCGNVDWWLENRDQCVHLKAQLGNELVGVVLIKRFWNLCSLFVSPSLQGQGIGRQLIRAAIAQCEGRSPKGAIWLNASPGAAAFYARFGFVPRASSQPLPPGFQAMQMML